ncbi:hypothetical protein IWQ47_000518 [Aquimarina sp. EL_43]|uniref:hypothetical protein n=1 Tax=unclassified Aquimarina TaxID=2627091 RepID=UPI0018CA9F41|nr:MULTISPECIES: hypothetical protein [unclassified Aquimarina]MBG6128790.1 hypothetical protein [Aquimarina sp. EL_35]MBG6149853.1 hypothetical protein [Aquimarina sp. EL_32]MBG6167460.1 hypothetical protein [Aquimarina sp. EL_43]
MKTSKSILYTFLLSLSIAIFLSCSNDDNGPGIDPNQEIILATFDYSNLSVNSVPNMFIANNAEGEILATVETNKVPGVYTLTAKGYTSNSFMLTTLLETDSYKGLITIKDVPVGSSAIAPNRHPTRNGSIKFTLNLTGATRIRLFVYGLKSRTSTDGVDPLTSAPTKTYEYNKEGSGDKILLKIRYKPNDVDPEVYGYTWIDNYKEIENRTLSFADFNIVPTSTITVNDTSDGSRTDLYAIYDTNRSVNLEGDFSQYLKITEGFEYYLTYYEASYPNNVHHSKAIKTNVFPEIVSVTKPDWNFSYTSTSNSLQVQPSGIYLCTNIRTEIINPAAKNLSWHITIPNNGANKITLPQLPESLSDYTNYFEDTSRFEDNSADLINLSNDFNYADYIKDAIDRTYELEEQNGESISIRFTP